MRTTLVPTLAVSLTSLLPASQPMPTGWTLAGDRPTEYAVSIEATAHTGKKSAHLACVVTKPTGFGTLMQRFDAAKIEAKGYG